MYIKSNLAIVLLLLCPPLSFAENTSQPNDSHLDELKINSSLQLHDVLELSLIHI